MGVKRSMKEIFKKAKADMTLCYMCPICNGEVCRGRLPGPGGKGRGQSFVNNVQALKNIKLKMQVIREDYEVDTTFKLFNQSFSAPIMIAPIASVKQHFGTQMEEIDYARAINQGAKEAGIIPFFGDGTQPQFFEAGAKAINEFNYGIATIKPWRMDIVEAKYNLVKEASNLAVCMDVDAAGLVFLKHSPTPIQFKNTEDLAKIKKMVNGPFIVKGIMCVKDAQKAIDAKADAIIVSNHGGRVLDDSIATIDVLEEIVQYVNKSIKVFVDGGFRSGTDIFKALALGADAVLIGRPFTHAAIGGQAEGVKALASQYTEELKEAMRLTNAKNLKAINKNKIII